MGTSINLLLPQRSGALLAIARPSSVSAARSTLALPLPSSRMTTEPHSTARLAVGAASPRRRTDCHAPAPPMKASYSLRVLDGSMDEHFQRLMAEGIATHLELPANAAAKALLLNELVRQNVRPAALTGAVGHDVAGSSRLADMDLRRVSVASLPHCTRSASSSTFAPFESG